MVEYISKTFPVYVIPPVLSLVVGITLAVISVVKGRFRLENVLFALVLIWFNIIPPLFIMHYILRGQFQTLLVIERAAHCLYVFVPFITICYIWKSFGFTNKIIPSLAFLISAVISVFTWTPYYFTEFHVYSWGYIAKGNIVFQVFGAYAALTILGFIVFFIRQYTLSRNRTERLKIKYIILSFMLVSILTIMNIPAMSGVDFYAYGNFMFVPMLILAYGVLRHRLMDIKSILHVTFIWAVVSSLILIPNAVLFYLIRPYFGEMPDSALFSVLVVWFAINFLYFRTIQPAIDQLFNRRKYNLRKIEAEFIESIAYLRSITDLVKRFGDILSRAISIRKSLVIFRTAGEETYRDVSGGEYRVSDKMQEWFLGANHIVEKNQVPGNHYYEAVEEELVALFESTETESIVPLVQNYELVGLVLMGEKFNLQALTPNELNFINGTRAAAAISISNSLMFQNISDLKDNLEIKVNERTVELQAAMEKLESTNRRITVINDQLKQAQAIAALDMRMAANVQSSFLPKTAPRDDEWDIAYEFRPMSGVSGDFYDFYENDGKLTGLSLFDVSGHGIASGLITMIGRSVLGRHFMHDAKGKLHELIGKANEELVQELGNVENYLTGIVMRFKNDVVEYVNAGHPDIFYRKASDGSVLTVSEPDAKHKGSIIGVPGMNPNLKTVKFRVEQDDILLCASDCIYESTSATGEQYGEEKIMEALSRAPYHSSKQVLDYILIDFMHFTRGKELDDDLTIIVIKRKK